MNENGFIKLFRRIGEWEWYSEPNTFKVFIHLLLDANIQDRAYRGFVVKRGSTLTSVSSIAEKNGLSVQNVRTALKRLEKTGEITINSQTKFSIISMANYDKYQSVQQTTNNQLTTPKEYKNIDSKESIKRKEIHKEKKSDERFDELWKAYPKHVNKAKAKEKFEKMKVDDELFQKMLDSIERFKQTDNWKKDNGQFVPHLTTWLNQQRWEDEIPTTYQRTNSDEELFGGYDVFGL